MFLTLGLYIMSADKVEVDVMHGGDSFDQSDASQDCMRNGESPTKSNWLSSGDQIQEVKGTHKRQSSCLQSIQSTTTVSLSTKASSMVLMLSLSSYYYAYRWNHWALTTRPMFSSKISNCTNCKEDLLSSVAFFDVQYYWCATTEPWMYFGRWKDVDVKRHMIARPCKYQL